jgi:hypothetical protein
MFSDCCNVCNKLEATAKCKAKKVEAMKPKDKYGNCPTLAKDCCYGKTIADGKNTPFAEACP